MTDDIIERVARAILKAEFYDHGREEDFYESIEDFFAEVWPDHGTEALIKASSALDALRPGDRLPGGLVVVREHAYMMLVEYWNGECLSKDEGYMLSDMIKEVDLNTTAMSAECLQNDEK